MAGAHSGLSWVRTVVVRLVGFFCSGVTVLLFLWVLVCFNFDFDVSKIIHL